MRVHPYRVSRRPGAGHIPATGRHRAGTVALLVLSALLTSGCVKQGISAKSVEVHRLFYIILWLALPVFFFVEGMLLVSVVRFRRRRGDDTEPAQNAGGRAALTAFFAAPLAIILVLLIFGEAAVARVDRPDAHPAEELVVTGFQWAWSARYVHENVTVTGKTLKQTMTMELPVDTVTRIELRATDVMHEFYVPDLLYMRNAIPGHPNVFTVRPTRRGTYKGQCAQYCGLWHSKMALVVKVVTLDEFHAWLDGQRNSSGSTGTCAPTGSAAKLVAKQISWDTTCLAVTAGAPFTITIDNQDKGIAHNVAIYTDQTLQHRLYLSPDLTGPATGTFTVPALPAGTYYFQCDIHGPAMAGSLIIK